MPVLPIADKNVIVQKPKTGWVQTPWGYDGGQFGAIVHAAFLSPDGKFLYDRVMVEEGSHAIAIAWGVPQDGIPRLLLVKEQRDGVAVLNGEDIRFFWGPPRGFAEQTEVGIAAGAVEATVKKIAVRETSEEGGFRVKENQTKLLPPMYVNETCVRTASPLAMVEVDLSDFQGIREDKEGGEVIITSDFFTLDEAKAIIAAGEHEGACTTSGVMMSAVLLFEIHVVSKLAQRGVAVQV